MIKGLELRTRLVERRMSLEISDQARRFIAAQGFDPVYDARPLRRFIAREVETRIGRALLTDAIPVEALRRWLNDAIARIPSDSHSGGN